MTEVTFLLYPTDIHLKLHTCFEEYKYRSLTKAHNSILNLWLNSVPFLSLKKQNNFFVMCCIPQSLKEVSWNMIHGFMVIHVVVDYRLISLTLSWFMHLYGHKKNLRLNFCVIGCTYSKQALNVFIWNIVVLVQKYGPMTETHNCTLKFDYIVHIHGLGENFIFTFICFTIILFYHYQATENSQACCLSDCSCS